MKKEVFLMKKGKFLRFFRSFFFDLNPIFQKQPLNTLKVKYIIKNHIIRYKVISIHTYHM